MITNVASIPITVRTVAGGHPAPDPGLVSVGAHTEGGPPIISVLVTPADGGPALAVRLTPMLFPRFVAALEGASRRAFGMGLQGIVGEAIERMGEDTAPAAASAPPTRSDGVYVPGAPSRRNRHAAPPTGARGPQ